MFEWLLAYISILTIIKSWLFAIIYNNLPLHHRWHWQRYPSLVSFDFSSWWHIPFPLHGLKRSSHGFNLWWHLLPPNRLSGHTQTKSVWVSLHIPPFSQGCASHWVWAQYGPKYKKLRMISWNCNTSMKCPLYSYV